MASTFENIQAGMASSMSGKEGDSLMKGRTYIARLSPDTREALVKALRDRRKKKADDKMAARKSASDDYFASEADKAMAAERKARSDREMANEADKRMSEFSEQADIDATDQEIVDDQLSPMSMDFRYAKGRYDQKAAEARAGKSNKVTLSQSQLKHLDDWNERREKEGLPSLSQSEYFLLGDKTETSTQREDKEDGEVRRRQQEIRDSDREDITSEEIEQEELDRRNPLLAMQLRLAEDQRFKEKKNRVQDKKNFSENRANIRQYRRDRSLAQSDRENLGDVSFNRNQRLFEEIQRRNTLRKARAENAARNIRRYRP